MRNSGSEQREWRSLWTKKLINVITLSEETPAVLVGGKRWLLWLKLEAWSEAVTGKGFMKRLQPKKIRKSSSLGAPPARVRVLEACLCWTSYSLRQFSLPSYCHCLEHK